jgi:pyruvate,water dikinase
LARAARLYAEGRERAKAVFIDDNYTLRCALFELAARTAQRGGPVERRDFFLVTAEELPAFVADPEPFTAVIDERRRQRDHLQARRPPFVFVGQIPDPSTWPLRDPPRDDAASDGSGEPDRTDGSVPTGGSGGSGPAGGSGRLTSGTTLEGQGVCPGTTRGVVRVVRDPADPRALGPGDILVAPITDPAWTPLFLAVAGVVVEVGAQQSHAAIVARELGIPAIVGVADATTRLADGQLIEIDGATGVVTIV